MNARFCIKPEYLREMLAALAEIGIEPLQVYDRDDGAVAVEVGSITDVQGQALVSDFKHEWSAIIGIVGGHPFETRH